MERPEPNSLFFNLSSFFVDVMKRFERRLDLRAVVGVLVGVGRSFSFGGIKPSNWRFSSELGGGWCDCDDERSCCKNFGRLLLSLPNNEMRPCCDNVEHFVNGLWVDPSKLDISLLALFTGRWWLDDDKLCCLNGRENEEILRMLRRISVPCRWTHLWGNVELFPE